MPQVFGAIIKRIPIAMIYDHALSGLANNLPMQKNRILAVPPSCVYALMIRAKDRMPIELRHFGISIIVHNKLIAVALSGFNNQNLAHIGNGPAA